MSLSRTESNIPTLSQGSHSTLKKDGEEGGERYHKGGFHPVHLGELYNGKYKVLRKLGYGRYSTMWLVKDEQ